MRNKYLQRSSLACFIASILLEYGMRTEKIAISDKPLFSGISLILILVAIGMNVSIIRKMGIPQNTKRASQAIGFILILYIFALYIIFP